MGKGQFLTTRAVYAWLVFIFHPINLQRVKCFTFYLLIIICSLCIAFSEFFDVETMDQLNRLKRDYEKRLKFVSSKDQYAIELLNRIVDIECNLAKKYPSVSVVQLLSSNGQVRPLHSGIMFVSFVCSYI